MCGILGSFARPVSDDRRQRFARALTLLSHRGPDALRVWSDDRVLLGHTRLSIVDLSDAANQPMLDAAGRFAVVFNGEIYNYQELRRELEELGAQFRTDSDTEVILAAFERWGPSCLRRFNGMFAFGLYDRPERRLWLVRDRYGVKPLYYSQHDGGVDFSSEMKALLALGADAKPNWPLVGRYLSGWGCDDGEPTVFNGVQAVPPGHYLEFAEGRSHLICWWNILDHLVDVPRHYADRVEQFRELLADAVRLRLRNDVETGVCLSGGMDSSAVYGFSRQLRDRGRVRFATSGAPKQFRVFSISYPDAPTDEYPWVQQCVRFWNDADPVVVVRPSPDCFPDLLDQVIWHQEAPVWSASVMACHILYRHIAEQGTRVILEGHGGDELLGGYPYLSQAAVESFAARGDWWRTWQAARCQVRTRNADIDERCDPAWRIFLRVLPRWPAARRWLAWQTRRWKARSSSPANSPSAKALFAPEVTAGWVQPTPRDLPDQSRLSAALYLAFTQHTLPIILRVIDRATMAYSLESRSPLLDYRVVQYAFSLPDEDKISGQTKRILRSAAAGVVPPSVINRRAKLGFALAEREWFNTPVVRECLLDVCGSSAVQQCPFLDGPALRADVERCARAGFDWNDATRVWMPLNVALWHERFVCGSILPRHPENHDADRVHYVQAGR